MSELLFASLLLGHLAGDFLFQPWQLIRRKSELPILGLHILLLTMSHVVFLVPHFASLSGYLWLLLIPSTHVVIDACKLRLQRRFGRSWILFALDQMAHILILGVVFVQLGGGVEAGLFHLVWPALGLVGLRVLTQPLFRSLRESP